ncbi:hypothetical protein HPB48_007469 [Haemaphysalis longicornis]|uniref:Uncharacterized protein n=1 Tax=Haemaphysalis longicornis TaxID=44386 RepID=A0A9J6GGA3_HAELO|nr:hypothetical protein HPB48_007469 [Haemaphysalis longicornis]
MAGDHVANENKDLKNLDLPPLGWKRNLALLMIKGADELLSTLFFLAATETGPLAKCPKLLSMLEVRVHFAVWFGGPLSRMLFFSIHPALRTFFGVRFSRAAHERGPGHRSQGGHTPTPVPSEHQAEGAPVYQKFLIKFVLVPSGCRVDSRRLSFQRAFPRVGRLQGADWN